MPVIDAIDEKKYGRLLAKYLPGVIRSDEEHDRLAGLLMKLALAGESTGEEAQRVRRAPPVGPGTVSRRTPFCASSPKERLIELLERLVDDYDERRMQGRLEALEPLALLEHLMEEGGLKQVDLVDCFGSQSVVSAVIAGKRQINSEHARRLSRRFGLPLAMFLV